VAPDVNRILDTALPASKDLYTAVIAELTADQQLDPALVVWSRLVALHPRMSPVEIYPFTGALLASGRLSELQQVWRQVTSMTAHPPSDPPGSIIWDGSFESGITGNGLAWQIPAAQNGVVAALDSNQAHSGRQSLELLFDGEHNVDYTGPCHWAIANPGGTYLFSAWVRTNALTSDEGIRFALRSFSSSGTQVAETRDVHGTEPWTNVALTWTAPRNNPVVQVCVTRNASGGPDADIEGTAWIDDVTLTPQVPENAKR
jgi:hypothetical protein